MSAWIEAADTDWPYAILKNENLEVHISSMGATILKLFVNDRQGNPTDVVLGYESLEDYPLRKGYLGAAVGRVANRIEEGRFELDGIIYNLPINNGPNSLHGGQEGISFRRFDMAVQENQAIFFTVSPHMEEGYPGNLMMMIVYTLKEHALDVEYVGAADRTTLLNMTNHTYFNLAGDGSWVGEQILEVAADRYAPVDKDGLVTGEIRKVEGTPFDFREEKRISDALESHHPQITSAKGLDHPFLFSKEKEQVRLYSPKTGIELTVSTTLPQAQIYSANYVEGDPGKYGILNPQSGICFETQCMPNDINLNFGRSQTILKKGRAYDEKTTYAFKVK
jgi:aldose 1-epimerase